jgi:hypothetical protein
MCLGFINNFVELLCLQKFGMQMYPEPTRFFTPQLEGLPFTVRDLEAALTWASHRSDIRLHIRLDCVCSPEVIEVYPQGALFPRWCIWQTHEGRLQVDDLVRNEFALPYPIIDMALRFIASAP